MTITLECEFGTPLTVLLGDRFGDRVEIEAVEFIGQAPIEWRIGDGAWRAGLHAGHPATRAFHDLQRPVAGGTRGLPAAQVTIDTLGIGCAPLMIWLREGTYSDKSHALPIVGQTCNE